MADPISPVTTAATVIKAVEGVIKIVDTGINVADKIADRLQEVTIIITNNFGRAINIHLSCWSEEKWIEIQDNITLEFNFSKDRLGVTSCLCRVRYNKKEAFFSVYGDSAPRYCYNIYAIHYTHIIENNSNRIDWDGWVLLPQINQAPNPINEPTGNNCTRPLINQKTLFNLAKHKFDTQTLGTNFEHADVDFIDNDGLNFMHLAAINGNIDAAAEFFNRKPNLINATDSHRQQPIHLAAENGHFEVLKFLIENQCDVNALANDENDANNVTPSFSPLHYASCYSHADCVKLLMENKANVNQQDKNGWTALHWASDQKHFEVVESLLNNDNLPNSGKIIVDAVNDDNLTPLYYACKNGNFEITQLLSDNGANINFVDNDNSNLFHHACKNGCLKIAELLIENIANINATDNFNQTSLHYACEYEHFKIVELLLEKRHIKIDIVDKYGQTPFHYACRKGSFKIAELFLTHKLKHEVGINVKDKESKTPLHFACENEHIEIVELLIKQKDILIDAVDKDGWTPLHYACENKRLEIVEMLLNKGAKTNILDTNNWLPLHFACNGSNSKNSDIVNLLLEKNEVKINAKNNNGWAPFHIACHYGNVEVAKILLNNGAKIDDTSEMNNSFHYACWKGFLGIAEFLLEKGADINVTDKDGQTALHFACLDGNFEVVKFLLEKDAKINVKNNEDQTSLHFACKIGNLNIVKFLLEKSVKINAKDKFGWTPLHFSCQQGHLEIAKMLSNKGAKIDVVDKSDKTPWDLALEAGFGNKFLEFKPGICTTKL